MIVSGYTVQKMRDGYWITRLSPAGDRALPTNLEIDPPLQSVARMILDDCGYIAHTDAARQFADRFLAELTGTIRGILTIPASRIDHWVASHAMAPAAERPASRGNAEQEPEPRHAVEDRYCLPRGVRRRARPV